MSMEEEIQTAIQKARDVNFRFYSAGNGVVDVIIMAIKNGYTLVKENKDER